MSRTEELFSRLLARECPDSTYRPKSHPLVLDRALGSLIYDADGREYIDLCAGFGVLPFGHNAQYLLNLMRQDGGAQPSLLHGLGDVYPSVDKVDFFEEFFSVMPPHLQKAAVALTGAQAIELALKTAILATGRRNFLAFEDSYHGLDLGVLPVTFRADFKSPFVRYLREETSRHLPFRSDLATIEEAIIQAEAANNPFAAVIVEPVQGRGGVIPADVAWLKGLRDVTARHGILLILDEVFTGFARTGRITFADDVKADLVCFGKAVGGGFPLSVCVGTDEVMNKWPPCESEALHTGTFFGHPLSCRAATATIREIKMTGIKDESAEKGVWLRQHLRDELSGFKVVSSIRGIGMMTGIEFRGRGVGALLMESLRARGVIAIPSGPTGNVLSITPALNIEPDILMKAVQLIKTAVFALPSQSH